jgi:hypothetical protein
MKKTKRCIGLLFATVLFGACTGQGGGTSTDSTVPLPTTPPTKAANPQSELDALAKRVKAVDYSRLSINHDGIFAVILRDKVRGAIYTVGTFTLWRWDGKVWNDVSTSVVGRPIDSEYFEPRSFTGTKTVTSYDFNEDGVIDFLFDFDDAERGLNHSVGAILSNRGGEWRWEFVEFLDGTVQQAATSWYYSPDSNQLTIRDYPPESMPTDVTVNWDPKREMFITDPNSYVYNGY